MNAHIKRNSILGGSLPATAIANTCRSARCRVYDENTYSKPVISEETFLTKFLNRLHAHPIVFSRAPPTEDVDRLNRLARFIIDSQESATTF